VGGQLAGTEAGVSRFNDKVVLITGSSSGIGEAAARQFAAEGATVVINSAHSIEAGQKVAASIPGAHYIQATLGEVGAAQRLIDETLQRCGQLDVLVNNAGTTQLIPHYDLATASVDVWRRIFEVNVFGTWEVSVAAMDHLKVAHGAIVNVTSIAGLRPSGSSIPYASSKAALNHMTVLLAKVVGPHVRVNAVAPGLVDTPWTAEWDTLRAAVTQMAPLKRTAQPDDVAEVILNLASTKFMTGQIVTVDGGLTLVS
jgi:ketoreductase RED2